MDEVTHKTMVDPWEMVRRIGGKATAGAASAQLALAGEYGRRRGWRLSDREFSLDALGRGGLGWNYRHGALNYHDIFDHAYFYRVGRAAAAIAAHPYNDPDQLRCEQLADLYGVSFEFPMDYPSWWYPGWTKLIVCVGPKGKIAHDSGEKI